MGNCASFREDVHVIVVGGGFAGLTVARGLDPYCRVTLVDKRESLFVNFGSVRAIVEPGFESKLFVDYRRVLKRGTFVQAEAVSVSATSVTVRREGGAAETITGTYVVLTTGSTYPAPMKGDGPSRAAVVQSFQRVQAALAAATDVVVVGGGPTAVEAAGEIKAALPRVNVTLVHSGATLLAGAQNGTNGPVSDKFLQLVAAKLATLGVVVKPNSRATRPAGLAPTEGLILTPNTIQTTTAGGATEALRADVTFFFTGGSPATDVIRASFPAAVDEQGYVSVTETLNLPGYGTVFAAGDIASSAVTQASKTSTPARAQGAHIVKAIRALMAGEPAPLFKTKPSTMTAVVLGRKHAAGYGDGSIFPEFVVKMLKADDYFSGTMRKTFTGSAKE